MAVTCYYQPLWTDIMGLQTTADYNSLNGSTTLQVALLTGAATARTTTRGWEFVSTAVAANAECTETGYSRKTLTSVTYSTTALVSTLTCANPSWTSVTWTTPTMAIFFDGKAASDAARPIIAIWDFGGAQSVTSGTFTLQIAAGGLVTWTAAA